MKYTWATSTHPGLVRDSNEDAVFPEEDGNSDGDLLVAVADGMGGHAAGEIASAVAIETIASSEAAAAERVREANRAVMGRGEARTDHHGMGTTLTIGLFRPDGTLDVGHAGDSRLYLSRRHELLQVTTDHSLVAEYLATGKITAEETVDHPQRNVITRALGISWDLEVDDHRVNLRPGDRVLLCSDGLTSMISDDEIATILSEQPAPQAAGWALIEAANQAGGEDNITVAIVDVLE